MMNFKILIHSIIINIEEVLHHLHVKKMLFGLLQVIQFH